MLIPAVSKSGSPLVLYGLMNINESNVTKSASSFQSCGDLQRRICCNSLRYRATGSIAGCIHKIVRRWVASESKTGDVIRPRQTVSCRLAIPQARKKRAGRLARGRGRVREADTDADGNFKAEEEETSIVLAFAGQLMVRWLLPDLGRSTISGITLTFFQRLVFVLPFSHSQSSVVSKTPSNRRIVFFRAKTHQIPSNPSPRTIIVRLPLLYKLRSRFRSLVIHTNKRVCSSRGKASPFSLAQSSSSSSSSETGAPVMGHGDISHSPRLSSRRFKSGLIINNAMHFRRC